MFGAARLESLVASHQLQPLNTLLAAVEAALNQWRGAASGETAAAPDDISLLVIERKQGL